MNRKFFLILLVVGLMFAKSGFAIAQNQDLGQQKKEDGKQVDEKSNHQPSKPLTVNQIRGNHQIQLIDFYFSETRGRNLIGVFQALDKKSNEKTKEKSNEKKLIFKFPAHSFTPHEATIINVVKWSAPWKEKMNGKKMELTLFPVFSVPQDGMKTYDFSRWYLIRIERKPRQLD